MISAQTLRTWLLQQPRPSACRLTCPDKVHTFPCTITSSNTWARVAETIVSLEPSVIEALDGAGGLLRALRPDSESSDESDDFTPQGDSSSAPSAPSEIRVSGSDAAETRRFELVAKLLADAYKHSTNVAFNEIVGVVKLVNARQESLERSLVKAEQNAANLQAEVLELQAELDEKANAPASNPLNDIASAFMGGMQHTPPAPAPTADPPLTNGKGHA